MKSTNTEWTEERFSREANVFAELVDEELLRILKAGEQVPNLHEGMIYALGLDVADRATRGKRIRPVLCLLAADALGVEALRALAFACAIELLHNFALVHDDIEDGDTMRRGRECTHLKYGLAHGINIGDYMFAKVVGVIVNDTHNPPELRADLLEVLNHTLERLFAGQAMDITARSSRSFTMEEYNKLVACKTGSYLAAPMIGAAKIARANDDVIRAIEKYGHALGPLFQIKDDLIDLTTGKGRGQIGNDIREGKRSYLVAAAQEHATADQRDQLYNILDKAREFTTDEDVTWVIDLFKKTDAITHAEDRCAKLQGESVKAIENLPDSLKSLLMVVSEKMAKREV